MIRDLIGPAHRPEKNGVMVTDLILPVVRHHLAVFLVVVAGCEVKLIELKFEAVLFRGGFENSYAFGNNFPADSVAWNYCDFVAALGLIRMRHG